MTKWKDTSDGLNRVKTCKIVTASTGLLPTVTDTAEYKTQLRTSIHPFPKDAQARMARRIKGPQRVSKG